MSNNKGIEESAYILGVLVQLYSMKLVNLAIHQDESASEIVEEGRASLQDVLNKLGISVQLPGPKAKDEIVSFFESDFGTLTDQIGKRLSILYSSRVNDIFFFSTSIAGYSMAKGQTGVSEEVNTLKELIPILAQPLKIEKSSVNKFLERPDDHWDDLVTELLRKDKSLIHKLFDTFNFEVGFWGISMDIKKAGKIIMEHLKGSK